jgi:two-component system response regulator WspF
MRIAIVNDLALARETLRRLVLSEPGHAIAWTANDGAEAVARAAADRPDLILMDLVMPGMGGVEATRRIMAQSPCPILIVTSSVSTNFNLVYEAMGCGGLDAVNTPSLGPGGTVAGGRDILERIAKLARAARGGVPPAPLAPAGAAATIAPATATRTPILALGASTGGPAAVAEILKAVSPVGGPAAVLVQHIAADFAPSLAHWLAGQTRWPVDVAREGAEPKAGRLLVAATNDHLVLRRDGRLAYIADPRDYPYRPSVDVFFGSLAAHAVGPGAAVLLTGMGSDGAAGLGRLRDAGWYTIAQDEATSVVWGMPRAAVERRAAAAVLPLGGIAGALRNHLRLG